MVATVKPGQRYISNIDASFAKYPNCCFAVPCVYSILSVSGRFSLYNCDPVHTKNAKMDNNALSACDDTELLNQVADGDKKSFRTLYLRHYRKVQQFIQRMIRHGDLAEEILNDTFFTVWKSAVEFNNASRVTTWIFGICYRKCLKALERDKRWKSRHCDSTAIESFLVDRQTWPDAEAGKTYLRLQLLQQLKALPAEQRMVLELTYFLGFSYIEIAEVADVPVNTVKTRMFHARKKLRRLMDSYSIVD